MTDFVKQHPRSPEGFFGWEAAGLRWLSSVDGGVPCARVLAVDATSLTLRRLQSVPPGRDAAHEFGGPDGWDGPGYFGPLSQPLPMSLRRHRHWGSF